MATVDRICELGFKYKVGDNDAVDVYSKDEKSVIIYAQMKPRSGIIRNTSYENLENDFSFEVWDSASFDINLDFNYKAYHDAIRARVNEIEANLLKGFKDQVLLIKNSINDPGEFAANVGLLEDSFIKPYGDDDIDRYICTVLLKEFCMKYGEVK